MRIKRKICIVTGTRAEYGILSLLMQSLKSDDRVELQIIATNMHLSPEFGLTYKEIVADGFNIDRKVEMLLSSDTHVGTVKSMGLASIGLADAYEELKPDVIVILGDRYEMLAAASAALIFGIPVAHLHGGEITEGAYDDSIRHAITKLSYLHFTSTEEYRNRVIQMGESPDRVHWVGALGIDGLTSMEFMTVDQLEESLDFKLGDSFIVVTFHPVTKEPDEAEQQVSNLLTSLEEVIDKHKILITLPNSDSGGRSITRIIREWAVNYPDRVCIVTSLGKKRYFSALKHCTAVVGNSSSGLLEAPSFGKPTLNIGNRQKGRAQGNTIVNSESDVISIKKGLEKVLSESMIQRSKDNGINPYYKSDTLKAIHKLLVDSEFPTQAVKQFFDIKFQ